mgnify:CR=1 FL=1
MTLHTKLNLLTDLNAVDPLTPLGKKIDKSVKAESAEAIRSREISEFETKSFCVNGEKNSTVTSFIILALSDELVRSGVQVFPNLTPTQNYKAITTYGICDVKTQKWFIKVPLNSNAATSGVRFADFAWEVHLDAAHLNKFIKSREPASAETRSLVVSMDLAEKVTYAKAMSEYFNEKLGKWMLKTE